MSVEFDMAGSGGFSLQDLDILRLVNSQEAFEFLHKKNFKSELQEKRFERKVCFAPSFFAAARNFVFRTSRNLLLKMLNSHKLVRHL